MSCCGNREGLRCSCKLRAGANIEISGTGASTSPYVITGKASDGPAPTPRGTIRYLQADVNQRVSPIEVNKTLTPVGALPLAIDNPDPDREALAIISHEIDLRFRLPAATGPGGYSAANTVLDGDEMHALMNATDVDQINAHSQAVKMSTRTIPPGGSVTDVMAVGASGGVGGAVVWAIQGWVRAWVVTL